MPARLSASDPRSAQYKWKRLITKPWADLDPHRMRRCEQLAARLHSALGRQWDVRRVDGIYRVERHVDPKGRARNRVELQVLMGVCAAAMRGAMWRLLG